MSMMNTGDILETIEMFTQDNLDVRTVTMGISLLDCIDPDPKKACENIYNKITTKAANLVPTVEHISAEYGIPIINKRISVTPIAMLLGACPDADPVEFAKTLDAAGKKVGVNFVGGYSALVHKGFSAGDRRLIESIPRALAETDIVCSSVNIGATKAGLNMDAVKLMGEAVKKASELTADCQCIGAAKLVVFPDQAGDYFVITIGVIFLVPSLVSIIGYFAQSTEMRSRFPVEGVGSLLFGLWLIIMPGFFADLLTFVLGFILVMGGVQQIASLSAARRWMPVPGGFYVVPVLILLAGLVALFNPTGVRSTAFIIIGISSLVYAASELLNWFKFTRRRPKTPDASVKAVDDIEDAQIIE